MLSTMDTAKATISTTNMEDEDETSQENKQPNEFWPVSYDEEKQKRHLDPDAPDMEMMTRGRRRSRRPGLAEEDTVCSEETSVTPVSQRPGAHSVPGGSSSVGIDVETTAEITASNQSTILLSAHAVDVNSVSQEVADLRQIVNTLQHQPATETVQAVPLQQDTESHSLDNKEEGREKSWFRRLGMILLTIAVITIVAIVATVAAKVLSPNNNNVQNSNDKQDLPAKSPGPSLRVTLSPTLPSSTEEQHFSPPSTPPPSSPPTLPPSTPPTLPPITPSTYPPTSPPSSPPTLPPASPPTPPPSGLPVPDTIPPTTPPLPETVPPVTSPAPPAELNDSCETANGPVHLGSIIRGNTTGAQTTNFNLFVSCLSDSIGISSRNSPKLWYIVEGTGNPLAVSMCLDDPESEGNTRLRITIFVASSCTQYECVETSTYNGFTQCDGGASLTWNSILGRTYFVVVHGRYRFDDGAFIFKIGSRPPNDYCENATPLTMDSVIQGSTFFADNEEEKSNCFDLHPITSPTVWYSFRNQQAMDQAVIATTCIEGQTSSVSVQVSVFQGPCDELVCIYGSYGDPEKVCSSHEAGSEWMVESNKIYFIAVHHGSENDFYSDGFFSLVVRATELSILPLPETPENDRCSGAKSLALDEYDVASTWGANFDRDVLNVWRNEWDNIGGPGVWYSFMGTGGRMDFYHPWFFAVAFFNGTNCNQLDTMSLGYSCASAGSSHCRSFDSLAGRQYYLLISGTYDGYAGDYYVGLGTRPSGALAPPSVVRHCSHSIQLEYDSIFEGNTSLGHFSRLTSSTYCGLGYYTYYRRSSVWYSFRSPTEEVVIASTCTGIPEHDVLIDTRVSVLQFESEEQVCRHMYDCVDWKEDDPNDFCIGEASVTWTAEANRTYKIVVSSPFNNAGQYYFVLRRAE